MVLMVVCGTRSTAAVLAVSASGASLCTDAGNCVHCPYSAAVRPLRSAARYAL